MKTIYIFSDYFVPAYRAGGPIKSLLLLVNKLSSYCKISVYSRRCDIDGVEFDRFEMHKIKSSFLESCRIIYLSNTFFSFIKIGHDLLKLSPDILYLNSFFSFKYSIFPLFLTKFISSDIIVVLSPRGELAAGSLSIKSSKKKIYIRFFLLFICPKRLQFHFTSANEAEDFLSLGSFKDFRYFISPNLVDPIQLMPVSPGLVRSDTLRIVYYSRISPKKNLIFFLNLLLISKKRIQLDIYGYIDDLQYWEECVKIINLFPCNISAEYYGAVMREKGVALIRNYDLFVLPTLNENFGHAIVESLSVGTPVLISDNTPWMSSEHKAINAVPLVLSLWNETLEGLSNLDHLAVAAARLEAVSLYADISARSDIDSYLSNFGVL